jgi:hypothetical protein
MFNVIPVTELVDVTLLVYVFDIGPIQMCLIHEVTDDAMYSFCHFNKSTILAILQYASHTTV